MTECYAPFEDKVLDLEYNYALEEWESPQGAVPYAVPLKEQQLPFGVNSSFIEGSKLQFAWDSVSLDLLKTCPRKYEYEILQGYQPPSMAPPLIFGICFHRLMQTHYLLLAEGMDFEDVVHRVTRLALLLGRQLPPGDTCRTKETLTRSYVWYTIRFAKDPARTVRLPSGKPAVELSFQFPFETIDDIQVYLCGHIDRLVEYQGEIYFSDYKTTKYALDQRFFEGFSPSNQMSLYRLAIDVIMNEPGAGGIIDGIQLLVNACRYGRHILDSGPEQVEETIMDLTSWIKRAKQFAEEGYWPKNETSCNKYSGCQFRSICAMSPARRHTYLDGQYVKRNWDPLVPR